MREGEQRLPMFAHSWQSLASRCSWAWLSQVNHSRDIPALPKWVSVALSLCLILEQQNWEEVSESHLEDLSLIQQKGQETTQKLTLFDSPWKKGFHCLETHIWFLSQTIVLSLNHDTKHSVLACTYHCVCGSLNDKEGYLIGAEVARLCIKQKKCGGKHQLAWNKPQASSFMCYQWWNSR